MKKTILLLALITPYLSQAEGLESATARLEDALKNQQTAQEEYQLANLERKAAEIIYSFAINNGDFFNNIIGPMFEDYVVKKYSLLHRQQIRKIKNLDDEFNQYSDMLVEKINSNIYKSINSGRTPTHKDIENWYLQAALNLKESS